MIEPYVASVHAWQIANPRLQPLLILSRVSKGAVVESFPLSSFEIERGLKIRPPIQRAAYFWQHSMLRIFLGHWLACAPDMVLFKTHDKGKLSVADPSLHFNISRSGNCLAFYFGPNAGGVDIEQRRSAAGFSEVAAQHFSAQEQQKLYADDMFFALWTRKEAVLKATGSGLFDNLSSLDCSRDKVLIEECKCHIRSFEHVSSIISLCLLDRQLDDCCCFDLECLTLEGLAQT